MFGFHLLLSLPKMNAQDLVCGENIISLYRNERERERGRHQSQQSSSSSSGSTAMSINISGNRLGGVGAFRGVL